MTEGPPTAIVRPRAWPIFAGLFIALTLLLGAVIVVHFYIDYRAERTRRDTNEALNVELAQRALVADVAAVTTDLMFLGRLVESLSFEPEVAEGRHRYLAEVFVTFAREKGLYDQIRFLDVRGLELVRVNLADGDPAKGFINLSMRVGSGRDLDTRKSCGDVLFNTLVEHLQPLLDSMPLAISFEMRELDEHVKYNRKSY